MDKDPKYLTLTKIQCDCANHWPYQLGTNCQASLQGGRHFLVTYAAYITQINVKYQLRCFALEIEPYKWLVQFYEGLDGKHRPG